MTSALLLSAGLGAVPGFVRERRRPGPAAPRVGFVAAATSIYPSAPWVDADREALASFGLDLVEVDLTVLSGERLAAAVAGLDAIYLAGGNTFALLHHLRRSGLDRLLPGLLDDGLLYLGASAGAAVAGLDVEPLSLMDDPAEAPALESTRGLGLVDLVLLPHADGKLAPYPSSLVERIVSTYGDRFPIQRIDDDQALLVADGATSLVPSSVVSPPPSQPAAG